MASEKRLMYADDFLDLFYVASAGQDKAFIKAVEMVVEDTPTVDAVEVVRCKDCIYAELAEDGDLYCDGPIGIFGTVGFNDFCSCGERKDNEQ